MNLEYFKYLNLFREDIREIISKFDLRLRNLKICDFGCGTGLSTFALALEFKKSLCIGLDKFSENSSYSLAKIKQIQKDLKLRCSAKQTLSNKIEEKTQFDLCQLIYDDLLPIFIKGNIVSDENLPLNIDFAFCQKIFLNLTNRKDISKDLEKDIISKTIRNIVNCLSSKSFLLSIEYSNFDLRSYLGDCDLKMAKFLKVSRYEIRSRGRTKVLSHFNVSLFKKVN